MKKNSLYIFVLSIMMFSSLMATPGDGIVDFEIPCVDGTINEEVCLPIIVDDFTGVSFAQIPIQWDPTQLEYIGLQNEIFLDGIAVPNIEEGTLRFILQDATLENPFDVADGTVIFEICFKVLTNGPVAALVEVKDIVDVPPPFPLQVLDIDGEDIVSGSKSGAVAINIDKVAFCINNPELIVGEMACFPLKAASFTDLQTFQFSLDYDPESMAFTEAINLNADIAFDVDAYNVITPGNIRLSWLSFVPGGATLDNGEIIAEFCFDVIALPVGSDILVIGDNIPGGIEATDTQNNLLAVEDNCTGLTSIFTFANNTLEFSLSPNPVNNDLYISSSDNDSFSYEILDLHGKLVRPMSEKGANTAVDISNLDAGVYFIQIQRDNKIGTRKFVKL